MFFSEKFDLQRKTYKTFILENATYNPSIYTMDHLKLTVSNFMEKIIGPKRVNNNMFSLQCHYDDLRGIAITPKATHFDVLTAGVDGIICGFDTSTCKAVSKVQLKVT